RPALPDGGPRRAIPHSLRTRDRVPPDPGEGTRCQIGVSQVAQGREEAMTPNAAGTRETRSEGMASANTTSMTMTQNERARSLNAFRRVGYAILPGDIFS